MGARERLHDTAMGGEEGRGVFGGGREGAEVWEVEFIQGERGGT